MPDAVQALEKNDVTDVERATVPTSDDIPVAGGTGESDLYGGKHLTKGVFWTLASTGLPLAVSLFSLPFIVRTLGVERFGVLTMVWLVVGYFGLVELGIGAALTKIVSEKRARGEVDDIAPLTWSAFGLLALLGLLGAVLVAGLAPFLVRNVLTIAEQHQTEALRTFYLVSISLPILTSGAAFNGIIVAYQRFGLLSALELPLGLLNLLGPVAALLLVDSLPAAAATVVLAQLLGSVGAYLICIRIEPALSWPRKMSLSSLRPLLRLGGWMTVSRVVGPLMVYFDRFLIGAVASMSAVAYYSTAYGLVTRLWILPHALTRVLFPTLSHSLAKDSDRAGALTGTGVKAVFLVLYPICFLAVFFAHEGLDLWLGPEFAMNGAPVLRWLTIGVLINGLAHIPFVLIQGAGRPDITAKLHMAELLPYLLVLWLLLDTYGIVGAAIAWTGRMVVDTLILFLVAGRLVPQTIRPTLRAMGAVGIGLAAIMPCLLVQSLLIKLWVTGAMLLLFPILAWKFALDGDERDFIREWLRDRGRPRMETATVPLGQPDAGGQPK